MELLVEARDTTMPHDVGGVKSHKFVGLQGASELADVARSYVVRESLHQQVVRVRPPHAQGRDGRDAPVVQMEQVDGVEVVLDLCASETVAKLVGKRGTSS